MKINPLFYLLSFTLILFSLSCQKNDAPTSLPGKIKSITYTFNQLSTPSSGVINYYFNNNGTLNYIINNGGFPYEKDTYTYSANRIILSSFDSLNREWGHTEFILAPNGLVDSIYSYMVPPDSIHSSKITYNANNEATQFKSFTYRFGGIPSYTPSETTNYTYGNGNVLTSSTYFQYTHELWSYSYDYYNTVSNLTPEAYGLPYNLLQSTHLVKTLMETHSSNPTNIIMETHTYTFDNNNRVATDILKSFYNGTITDQATYTYTYY